MPPLFNFERFSMIVLLLTNSGFQGLYFATGVFLILKVDIKLSRRFSSYRHIFRLRVVPHFPSGIVERA